jgi:hypothetical protein
MNRTIIASKLDSPPQQQVNEQLHDLGDSWRIVSATTICTPLPEQTPGTTHCMYVTTIALEDTARRLPLGI